MAAAAPPAEEKTLSIRHDFLNQAHNTLRSIFRRSHPMSMARHSRPRNHSGGRACMLGAMVLALLGHASALPASTVDAIERDPVEAACDPAVGPAFTVVERSRMKLEGEVFDCAGIQSLTLNAGAGNVELVLTSAEPGQAHWTFSVRRVDGNAPVAGVLSADGARIAGAELDLPSNLGASLSMAGLPALVVLALTLLVLGRAAFRST
jgi:hypothetical protein